MDSTRRRAFGLSFTQWLILGVLGVLGFAVWLVWVRPLLTLTYYRASSVEKARSGLHSDDDLVRRAAARGLGAKGWEASDAIPELIVTMNDESPKVASGAAWALGNILSYRVGVTNPPQPEVTAALKKALEHEDGDVRRYAAYAMSLNPDIAQDAIPALTQLLEDPHMAYMAARALGETGQGSGDINSKVAALLSSSKSGDRAEAAVALSKLQPLSDNTIAAIENLLDDDVDFVRTAAQKALNNIDSSANGP